MWRPRSIWMPMIAALLQLPQAAHATPDGALVEDVAGIANQVSAMRSWDRASVERLIGHKLDLRDGDGPFAFFVASNVRIGRLRVDVDFRWPRPNSGAKAGALLAFDLRAGCPSRKNVLARFGPLTLTDVPHGHSLDELSYWSRVSSNYKLSFGFPERAPECLAGFVFDHER